MSFNAYAQDKSEREGLWEKGIEAKENAEYKRAITLWEEAVAKGEGPDPRIGISYIELVTAQKLKDYYKDASSMYLSGLTGCTVDSREELEEELERLKPIAGDETFKQWKRFLNDDPAAACKSLVNFWEMVDPTTTTQYNERLIEHWERIAHARENFTRGRASVYNADERAVIYVKLGAPDYIRNGTLHFNNSLIRSWAQDGMELHASMNSGGNTISSAGGSGDSVASANRHQQFAMQQLVKEVMAENILKKARLMHRYPYYEIWVYRELASETRENVIYIFGEDGDTGEFGMQRSLEEMIPNSAFRTSFIDRTPISPGFLLQMLFYEQTSIADQYFADAFNELQSRLFTLNNFNTQASFSVRSQKASQLRFLQYKAPQEKSTYLEEMPNIELETYQYRMLDEHNRPYLATFVESQPQKAFFFDQLKLREYDNSGYQLYHYTKLADEENVVLDKQIRTSRIDHQGSGNVDNMKKSSTYFRIPNQSENSQQVFSVELHNLKTDSTRVGEAAFPENIRAIGKVNKTQPKPLNTSPDELEVSDILIGVDEGSETLNIKGPTAFTVLHDRVIPANKNMMIHFEVYHLQSSSPDPNRFEVEYQVRKKNRNIFQRLFGGTDEKVKLTLNFETFDSTFISDIEIGTSPFEPGKYKLVLKITEPATDQTVEREIDFVISDLE